MTPEQDKLVVDNLGLARSIAARLVQSHRGSRLLGYPDVEALAFLGLVLAARAFDPSRGVRFATYAYRACLRAVFAETKRRREHTSLPDHSLVDEKSAQADERSIRSDESQMVRNLVSTLDADDRTLIEQHYFAGRQLQDVATDFGLTKQSLVVRHRRAKRRLRTAALREIHT